jgi:pimeloyl-ACP methyl ester carboxylesterase
MDINGVPCVVREPAGGVRADAPVVVAWHLLDAPRNEKTLAAAVPMAGLDAWKLYIGLPMSGVRQPEGGDAEIRMRIAEDPILRLYRYVVDGALEELPGTLDGVRREFGLSPEAPLGVFGGSMGGAVAQLAIAESGLAIKAAVLVNPVTRMRATIDGLSRHFDNEYSWTPPSTSFAERTDFAARAGELAGVPIRYITGANDLREAFLDPTDTVVDTLKRQDATVDRQVVAGLAHGFYDEAADRPTREAAVVDQLATDWFQTYLS